MLKVGTLFSGIGAPEYALKKSKIDFETIFACENNTNAQITYLTNHSCKQFFYDVCKMPQKMPYVDILIFGFPCQPFSFAGRQKGFNDPRGLLVLKAIEVLKKIKPKYFIAENVLGLLKQEGVFQTLLTKFDKANYNVHHAILDSKDYGVPQQRKRIWIVGIRKDLKQEFRFPEPILNRPKLAEVLDRKVDPKFFVTKSFLDKEKVQRRLNSYTNDYCTCLTNAISRNGSSSEYISAVAAVYHAIGQARKPTPKECLRLQGFGDDFKIPESICLTQQYIQMGNTMTVTVLQAILEKLIC